MENIGYILLLIVVVCWLIAMLYGLIAAFPAGLIGFVAKKIYIFFMLTKGHEIYHTETI